ncbi:MAG: hypothetical protein KatS3mg038_1589 [Candidatus Kapaibacterium sp.]|nr:MAG: hypothetical protein KatS3mg038_1589 [Candidatus Kapabacteria bacterium]
MKEALMTTWRQLQDKWRTRMRDTRICRARPGRRR